MSSLLKCFKSILFLASDTYNNDNSHTYTNVNGLFSSEQPNDPFDTSVFDVAGTNILSSANVSNSQSNKPVKLNISELDMDFIAELEKSLGKKEVQANTNNQVLLAPPNVAPKKLNTEFSNSAIPRPLSSNNTNINTLYTNIASPSYYSTTELDILSLVSKYDSDPIYAANLNVAENKMKELCISDKSSNNSINNKTSNYYRRDLYSNAKTDNLTIASNYSSPYYSPPVDLSRYYSQTPNMYQIVPESNTVF